jgi:hypothetical protein
MTLYRVATVKATGKKYLVSYIDFRANKVVCWGEVVSRRGFATKHEGTKAFLLDFVEISPEAPRTEELMRSLVTQMLDGKAEEGHDIEVRHTRRGNIRYEIHPKKW